MVLDLFLVDRIERISHKIQRFFGPDCFLQAKVVLYTKSMIYLIIFFPGSKQKPGILFSALFLFCLYSYLLSTIKNDAYKNIKDGLLNSFRISGFPVRFFVLFSYLFLYPFQEHVYVWSVYHFCALLFFYLISCTPLPPQKSKLKEWLEEISSQGKPAMVKLR